MRDVSYHIPLGKVDEVVGQIFDRGYDFAGSSSPSVRSVINAGREVGCFFGNALLIYDEENSGRGFNDFVRGLEF